MNKKTLLFALMVLSASFLFSQTFPTSSWVDEADVSWFEEDQDEFEISSAEELAGLSVLVEEGHTFENKTIELISDIDLDGHLWMPIGRNNDFPFSGTFLGNEHEISNLWITGLNRDFIGLFGQTIGATFKDIYLDAVNIEDTGGDSGALVANMFTNGLIENCHVTNAEIHIEGPSVGGLISGVLTDSYVKRSSFSGNVSGENQVGGLASQAWDHSGISECYSEGTVTGSYIVGGLVGFGTMAFGPDRESTVENSYSRMHVVATDPVGMAGGIYGYAQMAVIIKNVYSTGTVEAPNAAGGFIGNAEGVEVENSYFDQETSEMENGIGQGNPDVVVEAKNTEEMTNAEFADVLNQGNQNGPWFFDPEKNDAYPILVPAPLSVDKIKGNLDVMIYPTQVETSFTIQTESNVDSYSIYGLNGNLIAEGSLNGSMSTVHVENLASGIYLVQIVGQEGKTTKRIIKK